MRLDPRVGEPIDRSKAVSFTFAGWKITGFEGDTIASAAFAAGKRVFSRSFKYHRPRGLLCCSRPLPELSDDRRRRAERARLHRADSRGRRRRGAERPLVARFRLHVRDGQARRPVHARRLLLPHVHPPARRLAAVREVPAQRGRAREARPARGPLPSLRHGAPARARARRRRRRGRSRGSARGGEGRAGSRPRRRRRETRHAVARRRRGARAGTRARDLGGRSRSGRCRHDPLSLPRGKDRRRDAARPSSRSSSRETTSSA